MNFFFTDFVDVQCRTPSLLVIELSTF